MFEYNIAILLGRVNLISKDNPDYPGIYLKLLETEDLIPVSIPEGLIPQLNLLSNNDVIGVDCRIAMKDNQIILIAKRIIICSRKVGN